MIIVDENKKYEFIKNLVKLLNNDQELIEQINNFNLNKGVNYFSYNFIDNKIITSGCLKGVEKYYLTVSVKFTINEINNPSYAARLVREAFLKEVEVLNELLFNPDDQQSLLRLFESIIIGLYPAELLTKDMLEVSVDFMSSNMMEVKMNEFFYLLNNDPNALRIVYSILEEDETHLRTVAEIYNGLKNSKMKLIYKNKVKLRIKEKNIGELLTINYYIGADGQYPGKITSEEINSFDKSDQLRLLDSNLISGNINIDYIELGPNDGLHFMQNIINQKPGVIFKSIKFTDDFMDIIIDEILLVSSVTRSIISTRKYVNYNQVNSVFSHFFKDKTDSIIVSDDIKNRLSKLLSIADRIYAFNNDTIDNYEDFENFKELIEN